MSDDSLSWYVNISPINRYLLIDILKSVGFTVAVIVVVQFLPIADYLKEFSVDMGGLILIVRGVALGMKLFTSFTGISIRFILDETGATVMEDHEAGVLKYVAEQVSTMRASKIEPKIPRMGWGQVSGVTGDPKRYVIVLNGNLGGALRLFCREDNYDEVLSYVNKRVNLERYVK
jgi:hypothetical protein